MSEDRSSERLKLERHPHKGGSGFVDVEQDGKVFRLLLDQDAIEDYLTSRRGEIWDDGDSYLMTENESAAARKIFALAQEYLEPHVNRERFVSYEISVEFLNRFPELPGAPLP